MMIIRNSIVLAAAITIFSSDEVLAQDCTEDSNAFVCYEAAMELLKQRSDELDGLRRELANLRIEMEGISEATSRALHQHNRMANAVVAFNRQGCPDGWSPQWGYAGLTVVGAAESGEGSAVSEINRVTRTKDGGQHTHSVKKHDRADKKEWHFGNDNSDDGWTSEEHPHHSHEQTLPPHVVLVFCKKSPPRN